MKRKKIRLKRKREETEPTEKRNEVRQSLRKHVFLSGLNRGEFLGKMRHILFAAAPCLSASLGVINLFPVRLV